MVNITAIELSQSVSAQEADSELNQTVDDISGHRYPAELNELQEHLAQKRLALGVAI